MRFIRSYYFLLYPLLGTLVGAYLGYQMDDIQAGCIDGLVLGALSAICYWISGYGLSS